MSFFKHFLQVARVLLVNFLSSLACMKLCSLSSFLWNDFQSSFLLSFPTQLLQTSLLCTLHLQSVLTCTNPLHFFKEHCANATPVHCCGMYRIFPPPPNNLTNCIYLGQWTATFTITCQESLAEQSKDKECFTHTCTTASGFRKLCAALRGACQLWGV